jgi:hypothetical protein
MKTSTKLNLNGINFEVVLFIAIVLVIFARIANAQTSSGGLYLGVEVASGSRAFNVNSDLQNLKGIKVAQHGKTYAIIAGNRLINGKIRIGNFSAPEGGKQPIQSNSFELGSSFSPLQLVARRTPILEPYLTVSIETTKIKTGGTYTPPPTKPSGAGGGSTCNCTCPSSVGGPPDPDALPVISKPVPFAGNFGSTRANIGVGLKAHVQKGKLFLNIFGEMNYGVTLGTTSSTPTLLNTYVLNQTAYNVGVSVGYIYTRSTMRRLHKVTFR